MNGTHIHWNATVVVQRVNIIEASFNNPTPGKHIQIVFEAMEVLWIFTCVRHNDVGTYFETTDIHPRYIYLTGGVK